MIYENLTSTSNPAQSRSSNGQERVRHYLHISRTGASPYSLVSHPGQLVFVFVFCSFVFRDILTPQQGIHSTYSKPRWLGNRWRQVPKIRTSKQEKKKSITWSQNNNTHFIIDVEPLFWENSETWGDILASMKEDLLFNKFYPILFWCGTILRAPKFRSLLVAAQSTRTVQYTGCISTGK